MRDSNVKSLNYAPPQSTETDAATTSPGVQTNPRIPTGVKNPARGTAEVRTATCTRRTDRDSAGATQHGRGRDAQRPAEPLISPTASSPQTTRHTHLRHRRVLGGGSELAGTVPRALRLPKRGRQSTLDLRPRLWASRIPQRLAVAIAIGGSALGRRAWGETGRQTDTRRSSAESSSAQCGPRQCGLKWEGRGFRAGAVSMGWAQEEEAELCDRNSLRF